MGISIDEIRHILVTSSGAPEIEVDAVDFADTTFENLGYDSLALMESAAAIRREYGVVLVDEIVSPTMTPRELAALLGSAAKAASA